MDIRILVSGHREVITEGIHIGFSRYLAVFDKREGRIASLLEKGARTMPQLVEAAPIYGSYPYAEPLLRYWEGQMIEKHLADLVEKGAVRRGPDGAYALT